MWTAPRPDAYCDYCRLNNTIPDLSVEGNREKWAGIEIAKRRRLYILDVLGIPYGTAEQGVDPPLSFDFKVDVIPADAVYPNAGSASRSRLHTSLRPCWTGSPDS